MSCGKDGCSYNGAGDANSELHARSGHVESNSALVAFLYELVTIFPPALSSSSSATKSTMT